MKVGYVRVSTTEQNTARQEVLMKQLGVEKVYIDKISGKSADRPQLQEMLAFGRMGRFLRLSLCGEWGSVRVRFTDVLNFIIKKKKYCVKAQNTVEIFS